MSVHRFHALDWFTIAGRGDCASVEPLDEATRDVNPRSLTGLTVDVDGTCYRVGGAETAAILGSPESLWRCGVSLLLHRQDVVPDPLLTLRTGNPAYEVETGRPAPWLLRLDLPDGSAYYTQTVALPLLRDEPVRRRVLQDMREQVLVTSRVYNARPSTRRIRWHIERSGSLPGAIEITAVLPA